MKKFQILVFALGLLLSLPSYSHSGGHGDIVLNESQAISVAYSVVHQFTQHDPGLGFGKLDSSWKNIPDAARKIFKKHHDYYIISLTNRDKTLYILMSTSGDIYDANLSGEFEGLK